MGLISADSDNDVDDHDYVTNYHSNWPHIGFAKHEASYCSTQLHENHPMYKNRWIMQQD
jgi:hypothetical protein